MPRFMVPEFGQKVNLESLVDATASEARFASVYPGGGVVSISRNRLPPADQRMIWPEAQVVPVVEWPGRDLMESGDRVAVAVVDDFAGLLLLPPGLTICYRWGRRWTARDREERCATSRSGRVRRGGSTLASSLGGWHDEPRR